MLDRTRDVLTSSLADCPGCRMAMIHHGSTLVSDRSGMVDRFECAPCGITRMRPRQATSAGEFDALALLHPASLSIGGDRSIPDVVVLPI